MANTHRSEHTTHELGIEPPGVVFARGRGDIMSLPVEIIQMIGQTMRIEDLSRLIQSCKTMYSQLNYILYRRMVVDDNYHAAIVHCIVGNRITPLRIFLDAGAKLGNRAARDYYATNIHTCKKNAGFIREHPLVAAASLGRVEIVRMLLERAEDVNAQNLAFFREMMNEYSALLMAITEGQVEVVQILVDAGIDLRGYSSGGKPSNIPLVRAAIHKNLNMVKIIAGKLRAERKTYRIQTYNSQCGHALRAAIAADSHQIVEYFLHDGLDPNSSRTSESFLYTAVTATPPSYDRGVMVELLLAYGASTETSDPGLIEACWARNFGVVKHVLRAGCRWRYRVREVRWARLLAESEGQLDIMRLWNDYMHRRIGDGDVMVE